MPTAVLVAVDSEETREEAIAVAEQLRRRGIASEVAPTADKFRKQIRYADRRGIPYVWFLRPDGGEVKDLRSGDQHAADPQAWLPPEEDRPPAGALEPVTTVVSATEVLHRRLATQRLLAERLGSPAAVVELLTCVQSQEFGHALWSLGMRSDRRRTRTPRRRSTGASSFGPTSCARPGTSSLPEDIGWLLAVTAPRVHQLNGTMYRKLGLDPAGMDRAADLIVDALDRRGGTHPGRAGSAAGQQRADAGLPGDERRAGGADRAAARCGGRSTRTR